MKTIFNLFYKVLELHCLNNAHSLMRKSNSATPPVWDSQNFAMHGSTAIEIPKNLKTLSHEVIEKDIDNISLFSQHRDGFSGSDLRHNSLASTKNLVSGSLDAQEGVNSLPQNSRKEDLVRIEKGKSFTPPGSSLCFGEPVLGLKLGRPANSANIFSAGNMNKRSKVTYQSMQTIRCQVEGCSLDLTSAKDYHRRHRICESHSKSPKVIVAGMERRFCQQCSRFHNLSEFDDKKRSCRRRLSDHNARRRKPQPEANHFARTGLFSSICEGRAHNFLLDKIPASASDSSGGFCSLKTTQARYAKIRHPVHLDGKQNLATDEIPKAISLQQLNSGPNTSVVNSETTVHPRALSLLSTATGTWGLNEPEITTSLEQLMLGSIRINQPILQLESQNWPLISSGNVVAEQAIMDLHNTNNLQIHEFWPFKTPGEPSFYNSGRLN